jgi:hypothetical protein
MSAITYLKGDATCPQAKGAKIIGHICNDIGGWAQNCKGTARRRQHGRSMDCCAHFDNLFGSK